MQQRFAGAGAIGLALVAFLAVVATIQLAQGGSESDVDVQGRSEQPSATAHTSPTVSATATTPVSEDDPGVQAALEYLNVREAISSGEPVIRMARVMDSAELNSLGLGTFPVETGCEIPFEVVILQGDFDFHAMNNGNPLPMQFVSFVFDARDMERLQVGGDPTGVSVQLALNDDSLPVPESVDSGVRLWQPVPCDTTPEILPGATDEDVDVYLTQEAISTVTPSQ